jgi:geranylgeranyl diphosphate synthase type I
MVAHQLATPAQRAHLTAEVIAETGAPARVEALIQHRVAEGIAALADAPIHEQARGALIDLAVAVTHRPA